MTRYTVVWTKTATDDLAESWLAAADRRNLASAADFVDWQLAQDAVTKGFEVNDRLRGLDVPPLRVLFTVNEDDRIVKVVRIQCS